MPVRGGPLQVTRLFVYPVKGCAGTEVPAVELDAFGPRNDRRWMVVGTDPGRFLTQRSHPAMALIRPRVDDGGGLAVDAPGEETLAVAVPPARAFRRPVRVWADGVEAADAGDEAARWLSRVLGDDVRLVHMPDDVIRPVDPSRAPRSDARVSFADGFPLLVVSEESLGELNRRLAATGAGPLPMDRFRPNVVVLAGEPHGEDRWERARLGAIEVRGVKPCARCVVTTVDQSTGKGGVEPLRTLATYRRREDGQVLFGQNAVHMQTGRLSVGDPVEILEAG